MFSLRDRQKCEELFKKYYQGRTFYDAKYRALIREHVQAGQRILDAGCGRYLRFSKELADSCEVVGIDLEAPLETTNSGSPYGVCGDLSHLPFRSECFDLVISRSVVEHLEDPSRVFREFSRILRSGGKVVIVTPNKYDYVSLVAAVTPHKFHQFLVSRIFRVPTDDVFPTLYRANTMSSIRKALTAAGLIEKHLDTVNHYPAYLMFSPILFRLGVCYERLTSLRPFRSLRGSILCVFEKEGARQMAVGDPQSLSSAPVAS